MSRLAGFVVLAEASPVFLRLTARDADFRVDAGSGTGGAGSTTSGGGRLIFVGSGTTGETAWLGAAATVGTGSDTVGASDILDQKNTAAAAAATTAAMSTHVAR